MAFLYSMIVALLPVVVSALVCVTSPCLPLFLSFLALPTSHRSALHIPCIESLLPTLLSRHPLLTISEEVLGRGEIILVFIKMWR